MKKAQVLPFHQFCSQVLKLKLTPGQEVIAKVAFGPYNPDDLKGEERALAREMFGGLEQVDESARKYICLMLGRGSGKTTLCSAFALYEAVTHDIAKCGPGDVPYVVVIAPDKVTAALSIRMCREMVRSQPALERLITADTAMMLQMQRPDGRMVRIEAFAASRGGAAVRGRTIIAFILDEAAFFTSNQDGGRDFAVNDKDIFRALKPRLLPSGKGMLISTPWPTESLFMELFDQNWGRCKTATAIKASTLMVRGDDPDIRKMVEEESDKDPDNARREFYCEVDGNLGGEFFDINALSMCLDDQADILGKSNPDYPIAIGADLGFVRDSSAIAVVQFTGRHYQTLHLEEFKPSPGKPLKPSDVMSKFAAITKSYKASGVVADSFYRESLKEALQSSGLVVYAAPEGVKGKADVFHRTRSVLHEGLVQVPDVAAGRRLIQQCKLVTSKPSPGGTTTIRVPRKLGYGHGDLCSAWVLAINDLAYRVVDSKKIQYEPGSPAWKAEFDRRVQSADQKKQDDYLKRVSKEVRSKMDEKAYRRSFVDRQ